MAHQGQDPKFPTEQLAWVAALIGGVVDRVQEENRKMITDIKNKTDKHDSEIAELQETTKNHGRMISELQKGKGSSADGDFMPSNVVIKGFCEFTAIRSEGATRADAEKLHAELRGALPKSLQFYVSDEVRLRGHRNMSYVVDVSGGKAREVAGSWTHMLANTPNSKYNGRVLKAVPETHPAVKSRNSVFGKLKSMAEHEFEGKEIIDKWYPQYSIEIKDNEGMITGFARLSPYGAKIVWEPAALELLGWTEVEAGQKFAAFRR